MPNTDPVVDSAAVLGSLVERARVEAEVPVGFLAAITKGQAGAELTEMVELAEAGAAGFSDDGQPVESPGLLRRALQYSAVAGPPIALHCEEPTLSRGGQMHEGAISAELGFGGWPSVGRERRWSRATSRSPRTRSGRSTCSTSPRASRSTSCGARRPAGVAATGEVTPHHLCRDGRDRPLRSTPNVKMNPPLRAEDDRQALLEALRDGTIGGDRDRPRPARAPREGGAVRGGAVRRDRARDRVRGALHAARPRPASLPLETLLERMSAGPARIYGLEAPRIAVGAPRRTSSCSTWSASGRSATTGFRSKSANSWLLGQTLKGRSSLTVADGPGGVTAA